MRLINLRLPSFLKKSESLYLFPFFCLCLLISVYRKKPSAKAKYMQKAADIDAASVSDNLIHFVRYYLSYFMFY